MTDAPSLTHVDDHGRARMVDISAKSASPRTAVATGRVHVGPEALQLVRENAIRKGDVLAVAQVAGVLGAKQAGEP